MTKDSFGDRMKAYEKARTSDVLIPNMVYYARLDGRGFSKLTKGLTRPFDRHFSDIMIHVTEYLVKETGAKIGYTQSDEISLLWDIGPESDMIFTGKIQKLCSILASMATSKFMLELSDSPELHSLKYKLPQFDCRIFEIPSDIEGVNVILWRYHDCKRNAISMTAHHMFGHKVLQNVSTESKLDMINEVQSFDEYPVEFRNGSFIKRQLFELIAYGEQKVIRSKVGKVMIDSINFSTLYKLIYDT